MRESKRANETVSVSVLDTALAELALIRPVFHSEADFQHALAWQLHQIDPKLEMRVERPINVDGKRICVDIVTHGRDRIGIELKYWVAGLEIEIHGEQYKLLETGAHDLCSYDFAKDVRRLERLRRLGHIDSGYAVVVCGDSAHWRNARAGTIGEAFHLQEGRTLAGRLSWSPQAGKGTTRNREEAIELAGTYEVRWKSHSKVTSARGGEFRRLVIRVI